MELSSKLLRTGLKPSEKEELRNLFEDPFVRNYLAAAEKVGRRYGWLIGGSGGGLAGYLAAVYKLPPALSFLPPVAAALLGAVIGGLSIGYLGSRIGKVIRRWMAENAIVSSKVLPFLVAGKAVPALQM